MRASAGVAKAETALRRNGLRAGAGRLHGCLLTLASAAFAVAAFAPSASAITCSSGTCTASASYKGSAEQWTVPAGVTSLTVVVKGAGGGGGEFPSGNKGGNGAKVTSTLTVAESESLKLVVGGGGSMFITGGYGGGGQGSFAAWDPGAAGGGGSFLFSEAGSLLIAAGGGGGAGAESASGGSGGHSGGNGTAHGAVGGGGGTASTGGSAGEHAQAGTGPTTSTSIQGKGGEGGNDLFSGGAGGGGYYGGGGGGSNSSFGQDGGGGGGSSTVNGGSGTSYETGGGGAGGNSFQYGANGEVTISFAQPATTTLLNASNTNPAVGAAVTYTATVSPVPTSGTVAFSEDGSPISGCSAQTVSTTSGVASCETTYGLPGSHSVLASYSGSADTIYPTSNSAAKSVVSTQSTTTTLASSSANPAVGQLVTYTATVFPPPPSGTVAFSDDSTPIAGCAAQAVNATSGVASCQVTYSAAGEHLIDAAFSGAEENGYLASSSQEAATVTVTAAPSSPLASATVSSRTAPLLAALDVLNRTPKALINGRWIPVRATCGQVACAITVTATLRLPGLRHTVALPGAVARLAAGSIGNADVRVPKTLRRMVRRFLLHHPHDKLKLVLTVRMTSSAGVSQHTTVVLPIWTLPGFR